MPDSPIEVQRARDILLATYERDGSFDAEQQARRARHHVLLAGSGEELGEELAKYLGWRFPITGALPPGLPERQNFVAEPSESYFDDVLSCCRTWALHYSWAPTELMWRDFFSCHPDLLPKGTARVLAEVASLQQKPEYIVVKVPTLLWEQSSLDLVWDFVKRELGDVIPRPKNVRARYTLEEQAQWVYARDVLGRTPRQIVDDRALNPNEVGQGTIERGIRRFRDLVGGGGEPVRGAPRNKQTRRS